MSLHCFENGGSISRGCHRDVLASKEVRWFHRPQKEVAVVAKLINIPRRAMKVPLFWFGEYKSPHWLGMFSWHKRERVPWLSCSVFRKGNLCIFLLPHKAVPIKLTNWGIKGASCPMLSHKFVCMGEGTVPVQGRTPLAALPLAVEQTVGKRLRPGDTLWI